MNLADYQSDIVSQIYALLLTDERNRGITLRGSTGSGKSTIALGIKDILQENWMFFYIRGVDPDLSPYLTWHIGTKLYSKSKINFASRISFGVNTLPIPLSFQFGGDIPKKEKTNFILSPSEEALLTNIKKQAETNKNVLFVADDFDLWDIPSKQFLQKITLPELGLMADYRIIILFISHEKISWDNGFIWSDLFIPSISDANLLSILHQKGYTYPFNLNEIRACAGNDLSLMLMVAKYYENNESGPIMNFNEIIDRRYNDLPERDRQACSILEPLSIIDACFSQYETAYFIDEPSIDDAELLYLADEYLLLAKEHAFIAGEQSYHFTNPKIRNYFKMRLSRREKYLHGKFALYLKQRHPEDYFNRGKHLKLSIWKNDDRLICEAWQLFLLAYIRRSSELNCREDVYNILPEIEALLERISPSHVDTQRNVMKSFLDGYSAFSKYEYRTALQHLQGISPMLFSSACRSECQRLIVLCHIQLAENPIMIRQTAEELYDVIQAPDFREDEQYCRAALVLLNVYTGRLNVPDKAKQLKQNLIQIINNHFYCPEFLELNACFNRKSALYYTAVVACRLTGESVRFYREHNNRNGLYMALCNHAANAIISGNYDLATQALNECQNLLEKRRNWHYPSRYKIENNKILLDYLQTESQVLGNRGKLMLAAEKAFLAFSKILDYQDEEVSHVIYLNHLAFSILCDLHTWPNQLAEANRRLADTDAYYKYYLHDLNFAGALLQKNLAKAMSELKILETLDVPLLYSDVPIFKAKRHIQERLLVSEEPFKGDAIDYNQVVLAACSHIQDPSCRFYGRGFLLSDLQFLSF
ncbi:hypothetical protein [Desulfotomaculum sp. 1211_IL3151]|uniref:hypothetical protein n=1 Tax=Desulfotomaculum sp. 1211_IL3151 TaxID=3084055 RepID=UPI002FDA6406